MKLTSWSFARIWDFWVFGLRYRFNARALYVGILFYYCESVILPFSEFIFVKWLKYFEYGLWTSLQEGGSEREGTSHPRIAHGQRYPMPCWEWSTDEVEWEQGSRPKGLMSCRKQGGISKRPEGAYFRPQMTDLGRWKRIWLQEGRLETWRSDSRSGKQIQGLEGRLEAWSA